MTLRILLYCDRPGIYGAEQINHEVAVALHDAGHDVLFAQPRADNHLVREREELGVVHYWLPDDDIYDLSRVSPSLVDSTTPLTILTSAAPDIVLFSDSCPFANLKAKQACSVRGIRWATTVHCINPQWLCDYAEFLPQVIEVLTEAEEVVAVSDANLAALRSDYGLPDHLGKVIINGRPPVFFRERDRGERSRVRAELGIPEDALVCITVARFEHSKGYHQQLEAILKLRKSPQWSNLHFVWVGQGTWQPQIERTARLISGGRVHFTGVRNDVPALLDAADVFVLTSEFEGMPLSVLEAMAKGLPVVATSVAGTPQAVQDGGILLGDPTEESIVDPLVDAIVHLASSPHAREELATAGRARARSTFAMERMHSHYCNLAQQIGAA